MDELKAFRNEISNYNYNKQKIIKLKESIDDKFYDYFGAKGVNFSKQTLENKYLEGIELKKIENLEKYNEFKKEKEKEIKRLQHQNNHIKRVLKGMNEQTKQIFISIYIKEKSYHQTCIDLNILDENGKPKLGELQYLMKKAFKED